MKGGIKEIQSWVPIKDWAEKHKVEKHHMMSKKEMLPMEKLGTRWYIKKNFKLRKELLPLFRRRFKQSETSFNKYKRIRGSKLSRNDRMDFLFNEKEILVYRDESMFKAQFSDIIISYYEHSNMAYMYADGIGTRELSIRRLFRNKNFIKCWKYKKYNIAYNTCFKDGVFETKIPKHSLLGKK